jgi:hypothetical protein
MFTKPLMKIIMFSTYLKLGRIIKKGNSMAEQNGIKLMNTWYYKIKIPIDCFGKTMMIETTGRYDEGKGFRVPTKLANKLSVLYISARKTEVLSVIPIAEEKKIKSFFK